LSWQSSRLPKLFFPCCKLLLLHRYASSFHHHHHYWSATGSFGAFSTLDFVLWCLNRAKTWGGECASSLGLLCVPRSRLRPRRPRLPFSVRNSQFFTGPDCKSTKHNQGRVNISVGVEVGASAILYAKKRSANHMQINQ
jgi:hypothetical protein